MKIGKTLKQFVIVFILFLILTISFYKDTSLTRVSAQTEDVTVTGNVGISELQFKVYPERRIPPVGNWDTIAIIQLRNCSTGATIYAFANVNTNPSGVGTINLSSNPLVGGNYRFAVRGASHLNRVFGCYSLTTGKPYVDLTLEGKSLLAGEISNIFDNYINSLDISIIIKNLYSSNYYSDLNQDSKVNSLDVSNLIINLYTKGDS